MASSVIPNLSCIQPRGNMPDNMTMQQLVNLPSGIYSVSGSQDANIIPDKYSILRVSKTNGYYPKLYECFQISGNKYWRGILNTSGTNVSWVLLT